MKKLLSFLMLVTIIFAACKQQGGNVSQQDLQAIYNPQSLLLTDDELPRSIDFNMDISKLSYQAKTQIKF